MMTSLLLSLGYDRTRNVEIGNKNIKLHHLEEAYTTEHWLVRIYRLDKPVYLTTPLSLTHTHTHRVKDVENRVEGTSPLRAIKHKRKYYPRKVGVANLLTLLSLNCVV